ncbi:MgtC/SapB family protein [Streptacidiphilus neutrinimicus]|uniref:MgtC/SapB family protein n=1 Tax=Streptacidiphilus neutrinimicus TaxID=105420 RepID=UPI0005A74948|nr:MgtC/SapB family protein [Streptacidiphilus neutrinimicus]
MAQFTALEVTQPLGEGWSQLVALAFAFVLSGVIGLERELRQKAAGLRTYIVVGVGAALFVMVSKYGFLDMTRYGSTIHINPATMAAQIVSGVGFIGAGVIFVQRSSVRGLTTAASIWLVAAVGAAAGAELPILASVATAGYLLVTFALRPLVHRLPSLRTTRYTYRVTYLQRPGMLRELVEACLDRDFLLAELATLSAGRPAGGPLFFEQLDEPTGEISLAVEGSGDPHHLELHIAALSGVLACSRTDHSDE